MNRTPARFALALAASLLGAASLVAQTPPPAQTRAADAMLEVQKAAFLALPLATRKAAQDALVWLGFYNGASDGDFGKRTRDSIAAFQKSQKAAGDGVLSPAQVQALLSEADKARAAVGFRVVDDAKTGARIGAPTRLMAEKNGPKLEFASSADPDLAALYQRLTAETPTRKIAYKAIKPGAFFVVSGQEGAMKFYSRFERSEGASQPIRGFTFSYPATAQNLDRVALAAANSFEPFPARGAAASGVQAAPPVQTARPPPAPAATALLVGPGRALTALKPEECSNPSIGGKPARFERSDAATGLAILAGDFGDRREPPRLGALKDDLVVLSASGDRLAASPATLGGDAEKPIIVASLDKSGTGSPTFNRDGGLAGLVAPIAAQPQRIAGVVIAAPHPIVGPEALKAFLGAVELSPEASAPLSAGAIAAREKTAVVAVFCEK